MRFKEKSKLAVRENGSKNEGMAIQSSINVFLNCYQGGN
jgi:hypothetical protein